MPCNWLSHGVMGVAETPRMRGDKPPPQSILPIFLSMPMVSACAQDRLSHGRGAWDFAPVAQLAEATV